MKSNGTRDSPAFKFQVEREALKANGKGSGAQVMEARPLHRRHELQGLIVHHDQD